MYIRRLLNAKKTAKSQYHRFLKLWHSEMLFKSCAVVVLMIINVLLLLYSSANLVNIQEDYLNKFFKVIGSFILLLYCALIIDIETSRKMKISFSAILMINFTCKETNQLVLGRVIDFFNFGILWCIFKYGDPKTISNEDYQDEYILPLINNDKKLLDAYNELWRQDEDSSLKSYNGLFVTRYVILSCIFLTLLIITVIEKYTNIDKKNFFNIQNIIELKSKNLFHTKNENFKKIFTFNQNNGVIYLHLLLITCIISIKSCYSHIDQFTNKIFGIMRNSRITPKEEKNQEETKVMINSNMENKIKENISENKNVKTDDKTIGLLKKEWTKYTVFFSIIFLFGMLTYDNQEFDLTSNIFIIRQESIIVLCIFLPVIGLLTELSMLKSWNWYFLFTLMIYNIKIWFDDPILKTISALISGILFNVSIILFISNIKGDFNNNKMKEYPYVLYILHKIVYFIGNNFTRYLALSLIINNYLYKFFVFTISLVIMGNILFLMCWNSISNSNLMQENEFEVEWEVSY